MSIFIPTINLNNIFDINIQILKSLNIKYIFLDIDNTIALPYCSSPIKGAKEWINLLNQHNIKIIIISNNYKKRVQDFADKINLPFVSFSMKPFGVGFYRAKKILNKQKPLCKITNDSILVVGDQIFTDIVGANIFKMKSALLNPISLDEPFTVKIKRILEKNIRAKIAKSKGDNILDLSQR